MNSWTEIYGLTIYNHYSSYDNNSNIRNGDWGSKNEYTTGSNLNSENFHSTTLLFGNSSNIFFIQTIPSCIIWYCINRFENWGKYAASASYSQYYGLGRLIYNHFLNYDNNNSNVNNGTEGTNDSWFTNSNDKYFNAHNTTLLFGNLR